MSHLSAGDVTAIFLALGVLLASARILGEICRRWGQPAVVGEILAGILLGPTVLGRFAPEFAARLVPLDGNVAIVLDGVITISICLFLLVAGMEVELSTVWRRGRTSAAVAIAGFAVPFAVAWSCASVAPLALGCELDADPRIFALFFGTAMSISALPVIAKILMDLGLYRSDFGMIVVAAAVFNDLVGWLVFAVILGLLGTQAPHGLGVTGTIALTLVCAAFALTVGRWLVNRSLPWIQAHTSWPGGVLGFAFSLALLAAALTEWIGIHAVFGAFLVGVSIGDSRHLRTETRRTMLDFVSFIFAPLFFASVGLRVDFAAKFYPEVVLPVLVIGCATKVLGCGLTARGTGMDWNSSWAIGFALNARGAMEIILGLLALQNGLIRQRMFVALVVLAVTTSMLSGPMIHRLLGRRRALRLADFLPPQGFLPNLTVADTRGAVVALIDSLAARGVIVTETQQEAFATQKFAQHGSLAIARCRVSGLRHSLLAVGLAPQGIVFEAEAGAPATIVCVVLAPSTHRREADALEEQLVEIMTRGETAHQAALATTLPEFLGVLTSSSGSVKKVVVGT